MKIGELSEFNNELHGHIATLGCSLPKLTLTPNLNKQSNEAPDYHVVVRSTVKLPGETEARTHQVQIGAAWKKTQLRGERAGSNFLSMSVDDPSFPSALHVAAFQNDSGKWDIIWRRRQVGNTETIQ